jgi:hypothetical protein
VKKLFTPPTVIRIGSTKDRGILVEMCFVVNTAFVLEEAQDLLLRSGFEFLVLLCHWPLMLWHNGDVYNLFKSLLVTDERV